MFLLNWGHYIILIMLTPGRPAKFGGVKRLCLSVLLETLFSTLLAPLRMVFHAWYCVLNLIGRKLTWGSQARHDKKTSLHEAVAAHAPGMAGAIIWAVFALAINETLFWWVCLIVTPLILGIPISILGSYPSLGKFFKKQGIFLTPPEIQPSRVLERYQALLTKH